VGGIKPSASSLFPLLLYILYTVYTAARNTRLYPVLVLVPSQLGTVVGTVHYFIILPY
jgi:hypothetical protein